MTSLFQLDPKITPRLHWAMIKDDVRSLCGESSKGPGRVNTAKFSCTVDMHSREDAENVLSQCCTAYGRFAYANSFLAQIQMYGLPKFQGSRLLVHYLQTHPGNRTEVVGCTGAETACRNGSHTFGLEEYFDQVQEILVQAGYASMGIVPNPRLGGSVPSYTAAAPTVVAGAFPNTSVYGYASPAVSSAGGVAYYAVSPTVYQHHIGTTIQQTAQATYQEPYGVPVMFQMSPSTGLPVNTTAGTVETESRGIHISNLSYKVSEHDLKKFVKQYGQPTKVILKTDSHGKSKGSAVATFKTADEAAIAAGRLHGVKWKGFALKVKVDRESTTSVKKERGPIIANGSTGV